MGQPSASQLHPVNVLLTEIGVQYRQDKSNYVFDKVFPVLGVSKPSNRYNIWTKADWQKDRAKPRSGGAQSAGSGYSTSTDTYNCEVLAFHKDVDYQSRATADAIFDLDAEAAEFVTDTLLLGQERKWVTDFFSTSIWATDNTPSNLWSDYTASDPGANVDTAIRTILLSTGKVANTAVLGYDTFLALKRHPAIEARFGLPLGSATNITEAQLAAYFGLDRVLVAKGMVDTGEDGGSASRSFTHGKHALICYVAPTVGPKTATAGVTFAWTGLEGAGYGSDIGISKIDMRPSGVKVDRIEGEIAYDNKVVASDLGYFFSGAVA
jgi:hypothetical protein